MKWFVVVGLTHYMPCPFQCCNLSIAINSFPVQYFWELMYHVTSSFSSFILLVCLFYSPFVLCFRVHSLVLILLVILVLFPHWVLVGNSTNVWGLGKVLCCIMLSFQLMICEHHYLCSNRYFRIIIRYRRGVISYLSLLKVSQSVALSTRGDCEYTIKERVAQSAGAAALVVINTEEGWLCRLDFKRCCSNLFFFFNYLLLNIGSRNDLNSKKHILDSLKITALIG